MPVIFTYPPAGIAPIAYSVSPRLTRASVGGKNSEKRSTRMPTAFATTKWPSSCRTINAMIPSSVQTRFIASVWQASHRFPRELTREAVGLVERLEGAHRLAAELFERLLDHGGDLEEA